MLEKAEALQVLAGMVRDSGYRATVDEDDHIESGMSGYKVLIFCNPNISNIQFYAGFNGVDPNVFGFREANAYNENWKYTKCVIGESSVGFEADFMVDLQNENASELVNEVIRSWEITLVAGARLLSEQTSSV